METGWAGERLIYFREQYNLNWYDLAKITKQIRDFLNHSFSKFWFNQIMKKKNSSKQTHMFRGERTKNSCQNISLNSYLKSWIFILYFQEGLLWE